MNTKNLLRLSIAELQQYRKSKCFEDDGISIDFINNMLTAKLKSSRNLLDFEVEFMESVGNIGRIDKLTELLQNAMVFIKNEHGMGYIDVTINGITSRWIKDLMINSARSIDELNDPMVVYSKISSEH